MLQITNIINTYSTIQTIEVISHLLSNNFVEIDSIWPHLKPDDNDMAL